MVLEHHQQRGRVTIDALAVGGSLPTYGLPTGSVRSVVSREIHDLSSMIKNLGNRNTVLSRHGVQEIDAPVLFVNTGIAQLVHRPVDRAPH